jgi:hypothetical protein
MELNDIKKEIYKQQPSAYLESINKDGIHYMTQVLAPGSENDESAEYIDVFFAIPFNDLGDAVFVERVAANHLIRWIVTT